MRFNVEFQERNSEFKADFGEVQFASDDSYDRGYAEGYEVGNADGYSKGHTDGNKQGYDRGYETGYNVGENDGYTKGYAEGNVEAQEEATAMDGLITRGINGNYYNNRVASIGDRSFMGCGSLGNITFPNVKTISAYAFQSCRNIKIADFPVCTSIGSNAFGYCSGLKALILRTTETVCTLGSNTFANSSIASGTGYIYVPAVLVEQYKTAANWSTYAAQIRAIEDYPEITGGED